MCNVSLISPIFALIIMFLESLGSLHIFAILGSILLIGGSRKGLGMVPAFLKFQIAAGDWSCFIFSNQDGLFVISCSLAALFQTTRMRMPHVASGVSLCWYRSGMWRMLVFGIFPRIVQTSLLSEQVL